MQPPHGQNPLRPLAIAGAPASAAELQQLLQVLNQQQGTQGRSAFSTLPPQTINIPEFNLYHSAQLSGLLNNNTNDAMSQNLSQLAQLQQLQNLQNAALLTLPGANLPAGLQGAVPGAALAMGADSAANRSAGPARSGSRNERSTTAYASRHQAAEQRRRNRINDRLDLLRKVVPHTERANTATFLEEVIRYCQDLQSKITALETAQGLPLSNPPRPGINEALADLSKPSQRVLSVAQAQESAQPVMSNLSQPLSLFPESNINTSNAAQSTLPKDRPRTPSQSSGEVEGGAEDKANATPNANVTPNANASPNATDPPLKRQRS